MIDHVKKVLADLKRVCPDYDAKAGLRDRRFRLVPGLERHGRWRHLSRTQNKLGGLCRVQRVLWHTSFAMCARIWSAPKMPFVIGVMGVGGDKATGGIANLRPAMAAPAAMPEFKGNVAAVRDGAVTGTSPGGHRGQVQQAQRAGLPLCETEACRGRSRPTATRSPTRCEKTTGIRIPKTAR